MTTSPYPEDERIRALFAGTASFEALNPDDFQGDDRALLERFLRLREGPPVDKTARLRKDYR